MHLVLEKLDFGMRDVQIVDLVFRTFFGFLERHFMLGILQSLNLVV